jgi:acyl-CoA synthetase (AMP-forming)/AMP-acid ligase II
MIFRSPYPDIAISDVPFAPFVLQHAERLAEKPAVVDGVTGQTYTYGQLAVAARRVAAGLAQRGFAKGDVLALYTPNLPEYLIPFLAAASLGGTTTTINPLYTVDELTFQLKDATAKYLFTVPAVLEKAREGQRRSAVEEVFVFGEAPGATSFETLLESDGVVPPVAIDVHEDVAALPYSSGTTGLAKGVMLTHQNLVANLCQLTSMGFVREEDVIVGVLPFFHIYGLVVILSLGLANGATIVSLPRFDFPQFLQTLQDYRVTVGNMVPPIMLAMAQQPIVDQSDLSSLRVILSAAAPLGKKLQEAVAQRLGCLVVQAWGLTETSPDVTFTPLDPAQVKAGSAGICVPNTACKVVDLATGAELGPSQEGEICAQGPQIMKGYLNNPEATARTLDAEGWLHTGDIGYFDEDGYLYIVDRLKELIKYKGMQVAPAELEAVLLTHPAVGDAAVIPSADEEAGEVPKAFVVLKPGAAATADELMAFVAERVAPHKRIRRLEFVEQIPKSASGKILRRVLIEQERATGPAGQDITVPPPPQTLVSRTPASEVPPTSQALARTAPIFPREPDSSAGMRRGQGTRPMLAALLVALVVLAALVGLMVSGIVHP